MMTPTCQPRVSYPWAWLLLTIFNLLFCAGAHAQGGKLEPIVLQLKWSHQFQFAGYYMAKHMGYYRDEGLEVEIRPGSAILDVTEQVVSGKADFGVGTSSLLIDYAEGKPVVVLGVIYQHSPLALIMRTQNSSDTLEDLDQGPMMIESHSGDLLAMLHRAGLSLDELKMMDRPDNAMERLENNQGVSSISAYLTDEPYTLDRQGINYITFTPRTYGVDFYGDNFFTTQRMLKERAGVVKGFRAATLKGWAEALRDPEKVIDLILLEYPTGNTREKLRYEARITQDLMTKLVDPGYMLTARWQHIADTYLETGMLKEMPDLGPFVFEENPRVLPTWFWPTVWGCILFILLLSVITFNFKRLNIRLQKEVTLRQETELSLKETNRELIMAKEISEEANLKKTWFISNVSHDLRAPISAIISLANIFDHHSKSLKLPDKFTRFIRQLNSGSEFLMLMLNNILDHSVFEMDAAMLHPEQVDVKQCMVDIVNLAQPLADERDLTIELKKHSGRNSFFMDRTRLYQILLNLIHNAIKFSPRGGTVIVQCSLQGGRLQIEVRDQGPGIPLEDQKHIFNMFTKSEKLSARHSGTGLGLSIVQRNTELLKGTIKIEQAQPTGAIFKISLPLEDGPM